MISAVSAKGLFRFMVVDTAVTGTVFRDFLKRLVAGMDRKIILVVDGHPSHKSKVVRDYVKEHASKIELVFLPPYSPELNPDELVWAHVKQRVAKATVSTQDELKAQIISVMRYLQKAPAYYHQFL